MNESVTRVEISNSVNAGVTWGKLGEDLVPIFEEQIARLERNYTIEQWARLDPMERALVVATRRIDNSMKNIQADEEIRSAKNKSKKGAS